MNLNNMIPETKLTLLAKEAQKTHGLVAILLIALLIQIISAVPQLIIMTPLVFVVEEAMYGSYSSGNVDLVLSSDLVSIVSLFCTVFCIIATIVYCTKIEKRSIHSLGFRGKSPFTEYLTGLGLGAGMLIVAWGICLATGSAVCLCMKGSLSPMLILFFLGFLVQGMSEEVFCRGFMMQSISARYAPIVAILLNAVFFAALHLGNSGIAPLALINLFLFGVFASLYMWKRGNIWGIAAFHSAWNFAQGNLVGIKVRGTSLGPSVLETRFSEAGTLINGGDFGIEGGLACTLVYVVGIIILLILPVRKDSSLVNSDNMYRCYRE